ncbi:hypothetical protein KAR91_65560 [Candidatus Pacearchaeota archaeon]|nr:hypothetical protein [Candidatus Pacearchaeota archaeon]
MYTKVSPTGQVTFFPKTELDIFTLGKLEERMKKEATFVRWEHTYDKAVIGRDKDAVARNLDPLGSSKYTLHSLTIPSEVLILCIKTHILREAV